MNDPGEVAAMRALWAAVLLQALRDAAGLIQGKDAELRRRQADAWIGSSDFRTVGDLAGILVTEVAARRAVCALEQAEGERIARSLVVRRVRSVAK